MTDYLFAIVSSRRPFAALFHVYSCEEEEDEERERERERNILSWDVALKIQTEKQANKQTKNKKRKKKEKKPLIQRGGLSH